MEVSMFDPRSILLAERLILWWNSEDPGRQLGPDSAHELAGVVMLAQAILELARLQAGASEKERGT